MQSGVTIREALVGDNVLVATIYGALTTRAVGAIQEALAPRLVDGLIRAVVVDLRGALYALQEDDVDASAQRFASAALRADCPVVYLVNPRHEPHARELCRAMARRRLLRVATSCAESALRWAASVQETAPDLVPAPSLAC